ncbi:canalicular multispecific organic anion transporter 1 isoform X2 [Octopus sinensis]|uniref:ABC-type glutathione-S-conjugate transporter n=1 Tax=Octopus sinensis TaxID=2607531 RepID=A0A7E6FJ91_9MOLL|nr:canalicular multispecific organic anion transporter 1 isoform X2 [Octopus sinensis]
MTNSNVSMFPLLCQEYFWELNNLLSNTCLQNTLVAWTPVGWLLITSFFYIPYLKRNKTIRKRLSYLTITKLTATSLLISATITFLLHINMIKHKDRTVINFGKGLTLFSQVLSLVLQYAEFKKRIFTSAVNFIYWLLAIFENIVWLIAVEEQAEPDKLESILVKISLSFKCALFLLFCFSEKRSKKLNPYETASFLSRLTFFWMTSVMIRGYRQRNRDNFVPNLMENDTTSYIHLKCKASEKTMNIFSFNFRKSKNHHWFSVLVRMFWKELIFIFLIRAMYDILVFVNPILLFYFLPFLESKTPGPKWIGYVFAFTFFIVNIAMSMADQAVYWRSNRLGLNVKTAISDAIYRKLLKKRGQLLQDVSIANLLSVDTDMFHECTAFLWVLWSAPFQFIICFVILAVHFKYVALYCGLIFPAYILVRYCLKKIGECQEEFLNEKDNRRCVMKEIMDKIKVIKLQALESIFLKKLQDIRIKELSFLQKRLLWDAFIATISEVLPFVVTLLMYMTLYFIQDTGSLSTENFFMMYMATSILETNFVIFPDVFADCAKTYKSYKRIDQFLSSPDNDFTIDNCKDFALVLENASFLAAGLQNLNLTVTPGELIVICGKSGSGKSALLQSMIGCIPKTSGSFKRKLKVAYAPQQPWIMSGTIKENIIFGKMFNDKRFSHATKYSALQEDLNNLKDSEETKVTDQGMNLSGGQRSRINLARTIFSRPDIFLLDDQLSALDPTSSNYIINNLFGKRGLLNEITRIIVTEPNSNWLSEADQVIVMDNGQIVEKGCYRQIQHTSSFKELLTKPSTSQLEIKSIGEEASDHLQKSSSRNLTPTFQKLNTRRNRTSYIISMPLTERCYSFAEGSAEKRFTSFYKRAQISSSYRRFARDLSRKVYMEGASMQMSSIEADDSLQNYELKSQEFRKYLKIVGMFGILVTFLMAAFYQATKVVSGLKLEGWTTDFANNTESNDLFIYGSFGLTQAIWLGLFYITTTLFAIRANKKIHLQMIESLLLSPLSFFSENSKFQVDYDFFNNLGEIDEELLNTYKMWCNAFFDIFATFVLICCQLNYLIPIIFILIIFLIIQMIIYIPVVIKLNQMYNLCSRNLLEHIAQTESGGDVIAAFSNESSFVKKNNLCMDQLQRYAHAIMTVERWSAFLLQFAGSLVIFGVCFYAAYERKGESIGLILTYLIKVSKSLDWFVRMTSHIIVMKVAVQQVNCLMGLKKENTDFEGNPFKKLPENWPEKGEIEFLDFSAKYESENTCCLSGIDLLIKPGEKVGIIGKSGSGKSSLIMALTQMVKCSHGILNIDGQNIFAADPQDLRSKLLIFPQDCELYSGTLRSNLDPYEQFTDEQLHNAMRTTELDLDLSKDYSNDAEVSSGMKQLIYLTKCLLKRSKVVILDEATANVSQKKSKQIMKIVEQNFNASTILCIAHKLDIVKNYDKILVMENGEPVEFGPPRQLMSRKNSYYYNMVLLSEKSGLLDTIYE